MSSQAKSRRAKRRRRRYRCVRCGEPATYYSHAKKRLRGDHEHNLCQRCWRAEVDRRRAKQGAERER